MAEFLKRTIKLEPIKVKYTSGNRIPFSAVPKRKATVREAMHILRNIFGFNVDLALKDCETREELDNMRMDMTNSLNGFLNGGDWSCLCENCYCYDDIYDVNFAEFAWMISYCQEKGIF